jgi:hypothetical protein
MAAIHHSVGVIYGSKASLPMLLGQREGCIIDIHNVSGPPTQAAASCRSSRPALSPYACDPSWQVTDVHPDGLRPTAGLGGNRVCDWIHVLVSVNKPGRPLPYSADRFSSQATRLAFGVSTVFGLAESACASESQTCPRVCGIARPARKRSGRTTAIDAG